MCVRLGWQCAGIRSRDGQAISKPHRSNGSIVKCLVYLTRRKVAAVLANGGQRLEVGCVYQASGVN